jgi:hypothetical protein
MWDHDRRPPGDIEGGGPPQIPSGGDPGGDPNPGGGGNPGRSGDQSDDPNERLSNKLIRREPKLFNGD